MREAGTHRDHRAPPGRLISPRRAGDEGAGGGEPPSAAASRLP